MTLKQAILAKLKERGELTSQQISAELLELNSSVRRILLKLHDEDAAHIIDWRGTAAVWIHGPGPNARRPPKKSNAERQAAYQAKNRRRINAKKRKAWNETVERRKAALAPLRAAQEASRAGKLNHWLLQLGHSQAKPAEPLRPQPVSSVFAWADLARPSDDPGQH